MPPHPPRSTPALEATGQVEQREKEADQDRPPAQGLCLKECPVLRFRLVGATLH